MYFDYFTTAALIDELNTVLAGGRVQDVLQMDEFSMGLEIYSQRSRQYLFMSADPEQPRVHLTSGKLRRGMEQPSPILLQMRRYIEGGKLVAIRQPAWERILIFDILHGEGEFSLIVEPIERRANIILVQDGQVKECIRRVFAEDNRVRQVLPGQPYQPPPPQAKLEPQLVTVQDIEKFLFSDAFARIQQALTRHIHGLSPLLGREIAYRAAGKPNAKVDEADASEVMEAFTEVVSPLLEHEWQPGYTVEIEAPDEDVTEGEILDEYVTAFAVFRVTFQH
ncbi:MAG TPA: NFACT family protein, partial [Aggregatilineales bacterium]|nr:NFACT family protein [Aggregatilineales bacterium]